MAEQDQTPQPEEQVSGEQTGQGEQQAEAVQAEVVSEGPEAKVVDKGARQWAMFAHLAGLAAFLPIVPLVGGIIGPLIVWQMKKEDFAFADEQGRESVNFQISILIYGLVSGLLCLACVGFVLLPAVYIFDAIFVIIAAVKANNGEHYRYPLTIRFLK